MRRTTFSTVSVIRRSMLEKATMQENATTSKLTVSTFLRNLVPRRSIISQTRGFPLTGTHHIGLFRTLSHWQGGLVSMSRRSQRLLLANEKSVGQRVILVIALFAFRYSQIIMDCGANQSIRPLWCGRKRRRRSRSAGALQDAGAPFGNAESYAGRRIFEKCPSYCAALKGLYVSGERFNFRLG